MPTEPSRSRETPPKGRPTPKRSERARVEQERDRRRALLQWLAFGLVLVALVVGFLVLVGPGGSGEIGPHGVR